MSLFGDSSKKQPSSKAYLICIPIILGSLFGLCSIISSEQKEEEKLPLVSRVELVKPQAGPSLKSRVVLAGSLLGTLLIGIVAQSIFAVLAGLMGSVVIFNFYSRV